MKKMPLLLFCFLMLLGSVSTFAEEGNVIVVNKGCPGNNTAQGLRRFQKDVADLKPDWLIVFFGMNDAINSHKLIPVDKYKANLQKMIDKAKGNGIGKIILVTINPVISEFVLARHKKHPVKDLNARIGKFNAAIKDLAAQNKIPLVDLHKFIMSKGGASKEKHCLMLNNANSKKNDGVHLTKDGYQSFAELLLPFFKGKIKKGNKVVCFGDSITYGAYMKGAGTAKGDTYPARLSIYLNEMVKSAKEKSQ